MIPTDNTLKKKHAFRILLMYSFDRNTGFVKIFRNTNKRETGWGYELGVLLVLNDVLSDVA